MKNLHRKKTAWLLIFAMVFCMCCTVGRPVSWVRADEAFDEAFDEAGGAGAAHQHTFACYEYWQLACEKEHAHALSCFTYPEGAEAACGLDEGAAHEHEEAGYECEPVGERVLICGMEEAAEQPQANPELRPGDILIDDGTDTDTDDFGNEYVQPEYVVWPEPEADSGSAAAGESGNTGNVEADNAGGEAGGNAAGDTTGDTTGDVTGEAGGNNAAGGSTDNESGIMPLSEDSNEESGDNSGIMPLNEDSNEESGEDSGIMPLNEESGIMPLNEDSNEESGEEADVNAFVDNGGVVLKNAKVPKAGEPGSGHKHSEECYATIYECRPIEKTDVIEVGDFAGLQAALTNAAPGEPVIIKLTQTVEVNGQLSIGSGKIVTLTAAPGAELCRAANYNGWFLLVKGELTLHDIIIDGHKVAGSKVLVYVYAGAVLNMEAGSVVQNNTGNNYGSGVYNAGGTFILNGGTVAGNTTSYTAGAGGIYNTGNFTANGGAISGNTGGVNGAGGVYSSVGINMSGATIADNLNGGVVVKDDYGVTANGEYLLANLTVTGNTGTTVSTSALCVKASGTWNIQGCRISDNTALYGALYLQGGEIRVTDCQITGNKGTSYAGGVYCAGSGQITIGEGTLVANNVGKDTGGLYASPYSNGSVTVDGAVIKDNTGGKNGGVYLIGKKFIFKSGAIYDNALADGVGNDFATGGLHQAYSLIAAGAMRDADESEDFFSGQEYTWLGAPTGTENLPQEFDGKNTVIRLAAKPNVARSFAKIGGAEYETLAAALAAVEEGGVIQVIYGEDGYGSKYELSEPFVIDKSVTISFAGQSILAKDGGELFSLGEGVELNLQGSAMLSGNIVVKEGNHLSLDGGIRPYWYSSGAIISKDFVVDVQGGDFTLNGEVVAESSGNLLQVKLAKGRFITAGQDFAVKQGVRIILDKETLESFNTARDYEAVADMVLIKGCGSAEAVSKIYLTDLIMGLNQARLAEGDIVLHKEAIYGVYLDGKKGSDSNSGESADQAVRTFAKAKELLAQTSYDTVYVVGEISMAGELNSEGAGRQVTLKRYPSNRGYLVVASGDLTLSDIILDGSASDFGVQDGQSLLYVARGKVTLDQSAVLRNNDLSQRGKYPEFGGGGVYVGGSGTLTMEDGAEIRDCRAGCGGGVLANGAFIMNGGTISDNQAVSIWAEDRSGCGGGVAIITNTGSMTMYGGEISGNTAAVSGGGIASPLHNNVAELLVYGGRISDNSAKQCGGGIYVQIGNTATIGYEEKSESKVYITGNKAGGTGQFAGGGIYVNGHNKLKNGVAQLYRVVVRDNHNMVDFGGSGLAGCGTSETRIYLTNGGAFFNNDGKNGNVDVFASYILGPSEHNGTPQVDISPVMLGGGAYNWIDTASNTAVPLDRLNGKRPVSYRSGSDREAQAAAEAEANVFITDNEGNNGAGIGSNGNIIIGSAPEEEPVSLTVKKSWNDAGYQENRPATVDFIIYRSAHDDAEPERYGVVRLQKANGWQPVTVDNLPAADPDGNPYSYTVQEEANGYKPEAEQSGSVWEFTNTPVYALKLAKEVAGNGAAPQTFEFEITLLQGGQPFSGSVAISQEDNQAGSLEFVSGKAKVTLAGGGFVQLQNLSGDMSYRIVETDDGNAANTEILVDGERSAAAAGDLKLGGNKVTFVNTFVKPETKTASLTVEKVWDHGDNPAGEQPRVVTVQLLQNGRAMQGAAYQVALNANMATPWTYTWTDLPAQDAQGNPYVYTAAEVEAPKGYAAAVSDVVDGRVTITNTYRKAGSGSLTIAKQVRGSAPADALFGFEVFLDGSQTAAYSFSLKAGETYTISGLPVGASYEVRETGLAGAYRADIVYSDRSVAENGATNSGVISAADESDLVTVTNFYQETPPDNSDNPDSPDNPGDNDGPRLPDPNDPDSPDAVTIQENDVPLTYVKVRDPETEEYVYLPEDELPLANVPKTGDNLLLWLFAAAVSGLAALGLGRKRG